MYTPSFDNLRRRRFREINERLSLLKASHVRKHLLLKGYFPEEQFLPSDFFNSSSLLKIPSTLKLYYTQRVFRENRVKSTTPCIVSFPKTSYAKRSLGVPNAECYLFTVDFISKHWKEIAKTLKLNPRKDLIVPYSYPLFYFGHKRSEISINNFKQFYEFDIRQWAHSYKYLLLADIENFYPSIYTHSIAWAMDHRTRDKFDLNIPANQLDVLIRRQNNNKTKGILIGPESSDLVSEIVLRSVDRFVSSNLKTIRKHFIAGRFKDDYIFLANDEDIARKILDKLQDILNSYYYLDINPNKTKIVRNFFEENSKLWKVETDALKDEIKKYQETSNGKSFVLYPERELSLWLRKTKQLYKEYEDQYIIKTILGTLVDSINNIDCVSIKGYTHAKNPHFRSISQLYLSVFENIFDLCENVPSLWPHFFVFFAFCFNKNNPDFDLIKKDMKGYLDDILINLTNKGEDLFGLIWCLYIYWRINIKIPNNIKSDIKKKFAKNWLVYSLVEKSAGYQEVNGNRYILINPTNQNIKPANKLLNVFVYSG